MGLWITVIAIVLVALLAALGWGRTRRGALPGPTSSNRKPTTRVDMGSTLRSYMIPDRWLGKGPGGQRSRDDAAAHPRYLSASMERLSDTGSPLASWTLLRGRTRLGRDSDNHVVLDDDRVSLHHALITVRDGVYWLEDLGSTNGTFVGDDARVMEAHPLIDGELVRLGGVSLAFRGRDQEPGVAGRRLGPATDQARSRIGWRRAPQSPGGPSKTPGQRSPQERQRPSSVRPKLRIR
jgi:hypothetical protein